jgi:hypothetical protein
VTLARAAQAPRRNKAKMTRAKAKFGSIQKKPSTIVSTFSIVRSTRFAINSRPFPTVLRSRAA